MAEKPKTILREMLREAALTMERFLIVEGPTDKGFYREWVRQVLGDESLDLVTVESVDNILIETEQIIDLGLNDGARSRVVFVAKEAKKAQVDFRCIADRDAGHRMKDFDFDTLLWTDYPALESYILTESGLDALNRHGFGERLPAGKVLLQNISPILRDLFRVRLHNEHLSAPNIEKGFTKGKSREASTFRVENTVPASISAHISSYATVTSADPREYGYGHDVASVLLAMYGNEIKNGAKLPQRESVEIALRLCLLVTGHFSSSGLATKIKAWLSPHSQPKSGT